MMDIEVTDAPELSGGGPQSVPSRILVVLLEEAIAGGTPRLGCPRDDHMILCKVCFIRFYTCHVFMPIMIAIFVIIYTVISFLCIYIHFIVICRLIVFCTKC